MPSQTVCSRIYIAYNYLEMCFYVILYPVILIKLFLENVKNVSSHETTLFWPEYKAPFYKFISDLVSDPDSNADPTRLFQFRIEFGSGQKDPIRNTGTRFG